MKVSYSEIKKLIKSNDKNKIRNVEFSKEGIRLELDKNKISCKVKGLKALSLIDEIAKEGIPYEVR